MRRVLLVQIIAPAVLLGGSALWASGETVSWTALYERANQSYAERRYAEAEKLYSAALAGARDARSNDPRIAQLLNNMGAQHHILGRYKEAETSYRLALAEWQKHPQMSDGLRCTKQNLAGVWRALGRFTESEVLYLEILEDSRKGAGGENATFAGTLNELALLYRSTGRNTEAQAAAERSVAISERLPSRDGSYGIRLHTLAAAYRAQGDLDRTEALLHRVLTLGSGEKPDDPLRAAALNSMSELFCVRGDFPKAESLAREAVALWEHCLGTDHPKVGIGLNNLAQAIRLQGRFAEAEPLYFRAISILGSTPGSAADLAKCQGNLADAYYALGRAPRAVEHYSIALSLMAGALGKDNPETAILMSRLAEVRGAQLHFQESMELYKSSIPILEAAFGGTDPRVRQSVASYRQVQREARSYLLPAR